MSEPFYETELQVGNRNFVRPRFDISGSLTSDGSLLYRLNGLYQRGDSFRDYDQKERRFFIAPALTWKISDRTDLIVSLEYADDELPAVFGLPAFGDGVVDVPRDRIPNEPDDTKTNQYPSIASNFEHRFSENWKLRNGFRYSNNKYDFNVIAYPEEFDEFKNLFDVNYIETAQNEKIKVSILANHLRYLAQFQWSFEQKL